MPEDFLRQSMLSAQFADRTKAQPFLKWAGGKRQLISAIEAYLPAKYTEYYEPFVGAGAVLLALQPVNSVTDTRLSRNLTRRVLINDTNSELINCYRVIKDRPQELLKLCQQHQENNSKEYYARLRQQDRQPGFAERPAVERAARIIYLNKTCFNGLYRVNKRGQFNVPYGKYKNPTIADPTVIEAVSTYLNQARLRILNTDFEQALATAKPGAFIYLDPPYHPLSDTSSFTGYSLHGFGEAEQIRLKEVCDRLSDRGCQILASNSAAPLIKSLYSGNRYKIVEVQATRAINTVSSKRGKINEVLIYNQYPLARSL